jgi:hypothetical protein
MTILGLRKAGEQERMSRKEAAFTQLEAHREIYIWRTRRAFLGLMPLWRSETIRAWIERGERA